MQIGECTGQGHVSKRQWSTSVMTSRRGTEACFDSPSIGAHGPIRLIQFTTTAVKHEVWTFFVLLRESACQKKRAATKGMTPGRAVLGHLSLNSLTRFCLSPACVRPWNRMRRRVQSIESLWWTGKAFQNAKEMAMAKLAGDYRLPYETLKKRTKSTNNFKN